MKKVILLVSFVVVLGVVFGPVLAAQASIPVTRSLSGENLSGVKYTEVQFRNEEQNLSLAGMLLIPEGKGPFPAVVMIHGAGTSVRDNSWYLTLASYLQENGIVVLLPDKRGSVKSEGDWRSSSYEDLATDTVAAVRFIQNQELVKVSKIGIIGMSQGGQFAPLVVHLVPEIAFMIDVVGTSLSSYDVLHYEEANNLVAMGFLPSVAELIAYPSTFVLREFTWKGYWDAVGNFDALPYWEELAIPALVMYGSADPNVPAQASKDRLEMLNKENIIVKIYPGSEHALQDPPEMGNRIFRSEALLDIKNFIYTVVQDE